MAQSAGTGHGSWAWATGAGAGSGLDLGWRGAYVSPTGEGTRSARTHVDLMRFDVGGAWDNDRTLGGA